MLMWSPMEVAVSEPSMSLALAPQATRASAAPARIDGRSRGGQRRGSRSTGTKYRVWRGWREREGNDPSGDAACTPPSRFEDGGAHLDPCAPPSTTSGPPSPCCRTEVAGRWPGRDQEAARTASTFDFSEDLGW